MQPVAKMMEQRAPYPQILSDLIERLSYASDGRDWRFRLEHYDRGQDSVGLTLVINITGPDAYHPEKTISVNHLMLVPPAGYNEASWRWWLFEQIGLVQLHERMEGFVIEGDRPYAPNHGHGWDPYLVTELSTEQARRTSFRNELNPRGTQVASPPMTPTARPSAPSRM
jgi:hypothetical protein